MTPLNEHIAVIFTSVKLINAVDRFATCLTNVEAWLRASRLRLNRTKTQVTKTQVMWLGSSQQLAKYDITDVHVLSSRTQPVTLALSSTAGCHCRLRSLSEDASKTSVHVFPGLLQLSVVIRHLRRKVAVGSEHCRSSGYWYSTFRPHNASAPSATLATSMLVRWLQGCHVHSSVTGLAFQGVGPQILHSLDIHHGLLVHTTEMGSPQKF